MQRQVAWATGKTGPEDVLLFFEAVRLAISDGLGILGSFRAGQWPQPNAQKKRRRRQFMKRKRLSEKPCLAIELKLDRDRKQRSAFDWPWMRSMERHLRGRWLEIRQELKR